MKNFETYLTPWPLLDQAWQTDHLGHALLVEGSRDKASGLATALSRQLTCEDRGDRNCACRSCRRDLASHPDVMHIQPEKDRIRRDVLQTVLEHIYRAPLWSAHLVIWVDQAHRLTEAAQNYLLKSLEEPPQYVVFILTTDQMQALLATVRSRCRVLRAAPDMDLGIKDFDPDEFFQSPDLSQEQIIQLAYWVRLQYRRRGDPAWLELWEASYRAYQHSNANGSPELIKEILRDVFEHVR